MKIDINKLVWFHVCNSQSIGYIPSQQVSRKTKIFFNIKLVLFCSQTSVGDQESVQ